MNVIEQAARAYAPAHSPVRTGRAIELQLFSQTTARLREAAANSGDMPRLAAALHENRRVWTHLACEVAGGDNALDPDLRARLFYLAEFVHHHSGRVLRREAAAGPLIEVNTAVMRGLSASGAKQ